MLMRAARTQFIRHARNMHSCVHACVTTAVQLAVHAIRDCPQSDRRTRCRSASDTATLSQRRISHLVHAMHGRDSEALLAQSRQFVSPLCSRVLGVQQAAVG